MDKRTKWLIEQKFSDYQKENGKEKYVIKNKSPNLYQNILKSAAAKIEKCKYLNNLLFYRLGCYRKKQ